MATPPISTSTILPWDWRGGKYSPVPCTRDSAHKTFGPTDLTSTYFVCTHRVFGGIGHQTQAFRSGVRCSKHQATHGLKDKPYWLTGLNLQNIIINPDMISDHQPHRIQHALDMFMKSIQEETCVVIDD
ncbi:hypothetical protein TNCV_3533611 [Trichonephila clavipes]|nr:hypothetical protein TNCV_3533611 [Trichonephila clavipes]